MANPPDGTGTGEGPTEGAPATHERVLVIDDDAAVGKAIARSLKPFQVTFAQSAAGAIGRIAAGAQFAAVVCDFRMPGMNGEQFFDEVFKIDPALARRIVFVSGAAGSPEVVEFLRRTGSTCVPKPFEAAELRRLVAAAAAKPRV